MLMLRTYPVPSVEPVCFPARTGGREVFEHSRFFVHIESDLSIMLGCVGRKSKRELISTVLREPCDLADVEREDSLHFSDDFRVSLTHVAGGDDAFGRGTVEMGTRIAHQAVTRLLKR
jgi:hypothetical protein